MTHYIRQPIGCHSGGHSRSNGALINGDHQNPDVRVLRHEVSGHLLVYKDPLLLVVSGPELDHGLLWSRHDDRLLNDHRPLRTWNLDRLHNGYRCRCGAGR